MLVVIGWFAGEHFVALLLAGLGYVDQRFARVEQYFDLFALSILASLSFTLTKVIGQVSRMISRKCSRNAPHIKKTLDKRIPILSGGEP